MSRTLFSILVVFLILVGLLFVANQSEVNERLAGNADYLRSQAEGAGAALSDAAKSVKASAENISNEAQKLGAEVVARSEEAAKTVAGTVTEKGAAALEDTQVALQDAANKISEAGKSAVALGKDQLAAGAAEAQKAAQEARQEIQQDIQTAAKSITAENVASAKGEEQNPRAALDTTTLAATQNATATVTNGAESASALRAILPAQKAETEFSGTFTKRFDLSNTAGESTFQKGRGKILFSYNSSVITNSGDGVLRMIASQLKQNGSLVARVTGNSDALGPRDANDWISNMRASAVAERLKALGVSAQQIRIGSASVTNPVASNRDWLGRQLNRRVDVVVASAQ
ncbi:MAG: OmpA family protein [Bdellovibrionales bacterium]|nr:OmpA family protein [Bdellovibrionales bacterium]